MRQADGRADIGALRALLARQTGEAAAEALRSGGQIAAGRLDDLGRLARLVELRETAVPTQAKRWPVVLVTVGTLACVSVLLFARKSSTEVEIDLTVSELSFVLPAAEAITDAMNLSSLGVTGLTALELPDPHVGPGRTLPASGVSLIAERAQGRTGEISLEPVMLPAGVRVSVQALGGQGRYRLNVGGVIRELSASVRGPVRIGVPGSMQEVWDFSFPRRVGLTPDSQGVSLVFTAADSMATPQTFRSPLAARNLSLFRVDQFHQAESTLALRVPTIQSGTLYFESVDGRARPLRSGEGLNLASSEGEIRELRLEGDGVKLRFHGSVRGMSTGSGAAERSLMPTLFDWLSARHGLSLLWGITGYVVGLFLALRAWWRRPS